MHCKKIILKNYYSVKVFHLHLEIEKTSESSRFSNILLPFWLSANVYEWTKLLTIWPAIFCFRGVDDDFNDDIMPSYHVTGNGRGQCHKYAGLTCSKYLGNRNVFIRSNTDQGRLEDRVTGNILYLITSLPFFSTQSVALVERLYF